MKSADRESIANELRASAISLLISLQALRDIQEANLEIAENASPPLDAELVQRHRAFSALLERAWKEGINALGVSREEYERELERVESYQEGLSEKDRPNETTFTWRRIE